VSSRCTPEDRGSRSEVDTEAALGHKLALELHEATQALQRGRVAASRRPQVDPSDAKRAARAIRSEKKSLQIERADARTRTGDPFITSVDQLSGGVVGGHEKPHGSEISTPPRWRPKTGDGNPVDPG